MRTTEFWRVQSVVIPAHSSMNLIQKSADDSEKVWESIKNRTVCQMGRDCNGFTVFGGVGDGVASLNRLPKPAHLCFLGRSGPERGSFSYERKSQEVMIVLVSILSLKKEGSKLFYCCPPSWAWV